MTTSKTCAACSGTPITINTVFWEQRWVVDLCLACLVLGDPEAELAPKDIEALLKDRANPEAPRTGFEARVREWIINQYGEGGTA